ncbi:MAG: methylenetetrahydrofolate reductase [Sphaerochaetaceae bacterium]
MKVVDLIKKAKRPLFTFELVPPLKGNSIESINATIERLLKYDPAYINITNHQSHIMYVEREDGVIERKLIRKRPGTIGLSAAIQYRYKVPVVPHLICGGNTKEQIEDQLVELNFLGIENILALRGDPSSIEKRFTPTEGGHAYSDELVKQIADTNKGMYLDPTLREPLATNFCVGVAGYPEKHLEAPNLEYDIAMLKQKVEAGAEYIVTQMFFINDYYFSFVEKCRDAGIHVPIIPGIKPIQRKRDLELLPQTFKVDLPSHLVSDITQSSSVQEVREIGIDFCITQVKELLSKGVPGVHFYTQGRGEPVAQVVEATF